MTLQVLGWLCSAVLGAALLAWADELAIRYNKSSTRLRMRYPHINPPPTPDRRETNIRTTIWLIPVGGLVLLLISVPVLMTDEL